jgi:hypothetical protein
MATLETETIRSANMGNQIPLSASRAYVTAFPIIKLSGDVQPRMCGQATTVCAFHDVTLIDKLPGSEFRHFFVW